jgi:hypothetical protein
LAAPKALHRSDQWLGRKVELALLVQTAKMTTLLTISKAGDRSIGACRTSGKSNDNQVGWAK